jgi:hypothetical protein
VKTLFHQQTLIVRRKMQIYNVNLTKARKNSTFPFAVFFTRCDKVVPGLGTTNLPLLLLLLLLLPISEFFLKELLTTF